MLCRKPLFCSFFAPKVPLICSKMIATRYIFEFWRFFCFFGVENNLNLKGFGDEVRESMAEVAIEEADTPWGRGVWTHLESATCGELARLFGVPHMLKVDIEGRDLDCVRSVLARGMRPTSAPAACDVQQGRHTRAPRLSGLLYFRSSCNGHWNPRSTGDNLW